MTSLKSQKTVSLLYYLKVIKMFRWHSRILHFPVSLFIFLNEKDHSYIYPLNFYNKLGLQLLFTISFKGIQLIGILALMLKNVK